MAKTQFVNSLAQFRAWLKTQEYSKIVVICDENTCNLCLPKLAAYKEVDFVSIKIKGGEKHKSIVDCEFIWNELMQNQIDRSCLIINLGGGMITDIGGFAAATFKRGLRFVNIPTTLLGMVDASIGNKTGLNFNGVKNQIGTFSKAEVIVLDASFLETLPEIEYKSGLGEVLKYGFIKEPNLLFDHDYFQDRINQSTIEHCVSIKEEIVAKDPTENGWRQVLNFGHTVGHALESYSLNIGSPIKHGEAVAWGMLAECFISEQKASFKHLDKTQRLILKYYDLPNWFGKMDFEQIHEYAKHDKKNKGGEINCTLLHELGKPEVGVHLSKEEFIDSLKWLQKLA
ncbi:MAG: 3-dehydroquinate synthase [Bacteroidia bacterium]